MTNFLIHEGRLDRVMELIIAIPEFENTPSRADIEKRFQGVPHLILTAHHEDEVVGFKLGYERDGKFYSWLGAVLPSFRNTGVANALADAQEQWARAQGYDRIRMKTRNCFSGMLIMAIRRNFRIIALYIRDDLSQNRIILEKTLTYNSKP